VESLLDSLDVRLADDPALLPVDGHLQGHLDRPPDVFIVRAQLAHHDSDVLLGLAVELLNLAGQLPVTHLLDAPDRLYKL
jgi:hypothetical protein